MACCDPQGVYSILRPVPIAGNSWYNHLDTDTIRKFRPAWVIVTLMMASHMTLYLAVSEYRPIVARGVVTFEARQVRLRLWSVIMCRVLMVWIVLCAGFVAMGIGPAVAQETADDSKCADYRTLFQGLRDARLRLTSGVYRGKGHRVLRTDEKGSMEGDVSFFCAFDYLNNRVRWDSEQPMIFMDPETQKESVNQIGYQLVQSREKTLYLDLGSGIGTQNILSVEAPDFRPPNYGLPFDVRTFGLSDWGSIEHGATFEDVSDAIDKCKVVGTREEPDGRCVITAVPHPQAQVELWINCEQGYSIERSEMRVLDKVTKKWGKIMSFMDVTWAEHGDVWVPTSVHLERYFNGPEMYDATLEWESVNQEPAAGLFEPDGLGLDPEGIIVDRRLGDKPVLIGKISGEPHPLRSGVELEKQTGMRYQWLFIGNAVAAGAIVLLYLWRAKLRKTRKS